MFTRKNLKLTHLAFFLSLANLLFFHLPFYRFIFNNVDYGSFAGILLIFSVVVLMLVANAFVFYLLFFISRYLGKFLTIVFFLASTVAVYFVNTYSVIIDDTMVGNVINTNVEESSSFFSFKLVLYVLFLGVLPSVVIFKAKIGKTPIRKSLITLGLTLLFIVSMIFANASNWLWIDKHAKQLGGLAMPWSYTVNLSRYYIKQHRKNKKAILLPNANIVNQDKSVVVLVIGESARQQNFSLYGYERNTNPLLSKTENLHHFKAQSCATYTMAGLKCILEHANTNDLYEILPNYLFRNDVDVVWRTTNWGEPPIHIEDYERKEDLKKDCLGGGCDYDEVLLAGLKERISASKKNKVLIILHTSTSHGPSYSKKYPPQFEVFKPVCNSVELSKCSQQELINAYDNTIVYTDYILHQVIEDLKGLKDYKSAMFFVSDHGESLGEKNLYMHGIPMSIAPKEQYEIPFIVWFSDGDKALKSNSSLTQNHVFHSVLNFLDIQSPIYNEQMNIFE
jgi:lipid A ethanolaminephosphotransferase